MYTVVSKFPGKTWGAPHVQTGAPFVLGYGGTNWISPHAAFASFKRTSYYLWLQFTLNICYLYKTAIIKCHNWIENHHGPACSSTYEYLLDVA